MDVEKLKQKILDLAIRGKLVPQDPNDEPASVLIEKIRAEKESLIKQGKIKRDKNESYIFKGDDNSYYEKIESETRKITVPFEIPNSWEWVRLCSLGQIIGGGTPSTDVKEYWENGSIPWITPADMGENRNKYITSTQRKISELGLSQSSATLMPPNSVVMSSRAPIGYLGITKIGLCTNQGCKSIVPYNSELSEYIYYAVMMAIPEIKDRASGTTFKEISGKGFGQTLIPLPPLCEQKKIVDLLIKSEKQFTIIQSNYGDMTKMVESLKYRILDSFFGENSRYKSYYEQLCDFEDEVSIFDYIRKPINREERQTRIHNAKKLYPYYGSTGLAGYIDEYLLDGEYVLLGEDAAPFLDKNAPKAYIVSGQFWVNNHAHILQSKTNNKFLMYYLNWYDYSKIVSGTTRLKLSQSQMKTIKFPSFSKSIKEKIVNDIAASFSIIDKIIEQPV